MSKPNLSPLEQTYQDVEKLLSWVVTQFVKRYGGDWDEYRSEANVVFLNVYEAFNPDLGSFANVLAISVKRRLIHRRNMNLRRRMDSLDRQVPGMDKGTLGDLVADAPKSTFSLQGLADSVSQDAKLVITLLFDAPAEVESEAEGKGGTPRNWRSSIRTYLRSKGWRNDRIAESFEEIKQALNI